MSRKTDVSWKVEPLHGFITVASFNSGMSHVAVYSGCWVVLYEGRLTPWIPEEAAEILKDLPSNPFDYGDYIEFMSDICPVCNGSGSPFRKKKLLSTTPNTMTPTCHNCDGDGTIVPELQERFVRLIITFLDGRRFEEMVDPTQLSEKITATRPDNEGLLTCHLVKEEPRDVFHYEEKLRLLQPLLPEDEASGSLH